MFSNLSSVSDMEDETDETEARWFLLTSGSLTYVVCVYDADRALLGCVEMDCFLSFMMK